MLGHVIGHMVGHMMGQTRFGHVTFPRSRASEVPESQFVTLSTYIAAGQCISMRKFFLMYIRDMFS